MRRDPAVRLIVHAWRRLTGGGRGRDAERRTLVACSGGADSAALVLALASSAQSAASLVVGHVVHDLRPREQVLQERDRVRGLAGSLGLAFVEAGVRVRGVGGNAEGVARQRRYAALAKMAEESGCGWVATAHQGDDLVETVLMRLVRGAGVRGLVGIHESRGMEGREGVQLIRPMLGVTRVDAERVCARAGWAPSEDPTNRDTSRLRAHIRHGVLPTLRIVAPGVHERVLETSRLMAGVCGVLAGVTEVVGAASAKGDWTMARRRARELPEVVLAEVLRDQVRRAGGAMDRLPARLLNEVCRVVRSEGTDPKMVRLPGVVVRVTARDVTVGRR